MGVYDSPNSPYTFREDDEAERERQSRLDLATLNAVSKVTSARAPAAPTTGLAGEGPTPEQMGVQPAQAPSLAGTMRTAMQSTLGAAPAAAPEGIQDFAAYIQRSNPMEAALRDRTVRAAQEQLDNPTAAFDLGAANAREDMDIAQRNQRERLRDDAALQYGGNASQVDEVLKDADQEAILARRGLNRDLTHGRAEAGRAGLAGAIQSALGLVSLGSQEQQNREAMGFSRSERLASEAFQSREAAAGRASSERVAFAGLAQQDRALAQQGMQFASQLEFNRSQLAANLSEADRNRIWQAIEAEKQRTSQERVAFAGLAQGDRQLAQQAMQFASELEFRRSEAAAGRSEAEIARAWQAAENEKARGSQERIAFAGLDLERTKFEAADANAKQGLSLEASAQAMTRTGMDREEAFRYASLAQAKALAEQGMSLEQMRVELTKQGLADENARYFAGLAHQDAQQTRELQSRVDVARMQIGSQERLQDAAQRFEGAQTELNRILQREMQERQLDSTMALERSRMDFEEAMADKGFLNTKELELLKNDFAAELQRNGFTQEAALQAAEHQARALEAEADRRFTASQADLNRAFTTSERVGAETFATSIQALENMQQERMAGLTHMLGLESAEKKFGYERALEEARMAHERFSQDRAITAEQAAANADRVFQTAMAREGFTQQQTLEAMRFQHEGAQTDKQLRQQYSMFLAEQAQDDAQFGQEIGLRREAMAQEQGRFVQELGLQMSRFGLEKAQWETLQADQKFNRDLELAMMGVQMWNGEDPADLQPFAARLAQTMGTALGMDPARLEEAIKGSIDKTEGGASKAATTDNLQDAIAQANAIAGQPGKDLAGFLQYVADKGNSPSVIKEFASVIDSRGYSVTPAKAMAALTTYLGAPAIIAAIGETEYKRLMGKG